MDINRDNYEEYFLLYADNELTDSEKAEVLIFLKQNKDLDEEFRMIHYTICKPELNVELADKSFLLRGNKEPVINEKNYEEVFVWYHDNELNDKQKKETADFLSLHPQLRNEFELIGLAKLIPDNSVIFPNKKKLYRREKAGKVVPIIFWRALAAAVLIGSGLWITQLYIQNDKRPAVAVGPVPAKSTTPVIKKNIPSEEKPVNPVVQPAEHNSQLSRTEVTGKNEKFQKSLSRKNTLTNTLVRASVKSPKAGRENFINQSPEKIINEEKINDEVVIINEKSKNIPKEQIAEDTQIEPLKELAENTIQANENVQPVMYARNASYVPDANGNSQNYVFYDITTQEFRRTKVNSFLKKVKRVIERNNPISRLLSASERQVVSN